MSFIINEPLADELISVSQGVLNTNNGILAAAFAKDHDALTDADVIARGKHTYIRLIEQTAPVPATLIDEGGLYVDDVDHDLYFKPFNNGTPVKIVNNSGGGNLFAWVRFTRAPAPGYAIAIAASSNVASVTRNPGTGVITVTFTVACADANYGYFISIAQNTIPTATTIANSIAFSETAGSGVIGTYNIFIVR